MDGTASSSSSSSSSPNNARGVARASVAPLLLLSVMALLQPSAVRAFLLPTGRRAPSAAAAPPRLVPPSKDTSTALARPSGARARWAAAAAAGDSNKEAAAASSGTDGQGQERAITLHTLELPVLEDPSGYRGLLQAKFPGATLLRWHLSEVVDRSPGNNVALAEVVVVGRRAAGEGGET